MICVTLNGNPQQSTAYTYTAHKLTGTTLTDTANAQTVATARDNGDEEQWGRTL